MSNWHCAFCVGKCRGDQRTIFVPWGAELGHCSLRSSGVPCLNLGRGGYVWTPRRGVSLRCARSSRVYYQTFWTSASGENWGSSLSLWIGITGGRGLHQTGTVVGLVSPENFNTAKFCVASASRELEEMRVLTYLLLDVVIYPSHPSKNQNFPPFRVPRLTGRSGQP